MYQMVLYLNKRTSTLPHLVFLGKVNFIPVVVKINFTNCIICRVYGTMQYRYIGAQ